MRKAISGITGLVSMLLVLLGLIISMCDTPELDKQLMLMFAGAGIMLIGTAFGFISMEVRSGNTR